MNRKIGRFEIPECFMSGSALESAQAVMSECGVVKCDFNWNKRVFEYVAISHQFDDVEEGVEPPEYTAIIDYDAEDDSMVVRFERVTSWFKL